MLDSIYHLELSFKLWLLGITGSLWRWFKLYLSAHSHLVSVEIRDVEQKHHYELEWVYR